MHRVLTVVEGFTERAVVEQVLAPHLMVRGLFLHARVIGKPGHKGGVRSFEAVTKEVLALLKQEPRSHVSTFFDYYGLPDDWPGVRQAKGRKAREIASIVEGAMHQEIRSKMDSFDNPNRFLPYVQLHEVEALCFADPQAMASVFENPNLAAQFKQIVCDCGGCEEINDHPTTAPSKRIESFFRTYRKGSGDRSHAPIILKRIGVDCLRQACPHFNDWITLLEGLVS